MSSDYVYRGNSLTALNDSVFEDGRVDGRELTIYRGEIKDPPAEVPKGTPVEELPWWTPYEDDDDDPGFYTKTQGVTGGFTYNLGTAITFGSGIPVVLFLNERRLSCARIRYDYHGMDGLDGALAWVVGDFTAGEVRTESDGLVGLVGRMGGDAVIEDWGDRALDTSATSYAAEHECVVLSESVDVTRALEATASYFERPGGPRRTLDGRVDGDVPADDHDAAKALHAHVQEAADHALGEYYVVAMNTTLLEQDVGLTRDMVEYATDGQTVYDPEDVPDLLLGE